MDDMQFLVEETYRHLHQFGPEFRHEQESIQNELLAVQKSDQIFPEGHGLIYNIQKSGAVFVIRTLVSANVRADLERIILVPEEYPSLRLLEGGAGEVEKKLKFFLVENISEAEIIHDQLHNRRFPMNEEMMCNLSDPGFSWWLTSKESGFQLSFTMSVTENSSLKLGPLGDRELALRNFQKLENLISSAGLSMNIQNETNRVQFTDCEDFILEELKDIFEFGVITQTLEDLFKILSRRIQNGSLIEETWFYLNELAAMRRFWIQIQYDLNAEST
jgi:hypothetical protein